MNSLEAERLYGRLSPQAVQALEWLYDLKPWMRYERLPVACSRGGASLVGHKLAESKRCKCYGGKRWSEYQLTVAGRKLVETVRRQREDAKLIAEHRENRHET